MDCSWSETMPFDRRKAADELLRGREFAQQLQILILRSSIGGDAAASSGSEDLLSRILNSFSKTLSMLNRYDSDDINGSIVDSPSPRDARKSEESGESCKSSTLNDRRGCYKRRKTSHSWKRESSSLVDDGHAWRKYGQKVILHAKYPRNYFRCTHKFDQGCQATKQVQRVEEDPPKFLTTYYGHHTCTNFLKASEIVLGSNLSDSCGGVLLRFDSPASTVVQDQMGQQDDFFLASFPDATVKKEEAVGIVMGRDDNQLCSPSNYMMSSSADQSPEHGDVLSEVMMGSVIDFEDDVLQFEF